MSKPLVIRDPIYGDLVFESPIREVIGSKHFQRLKGIKQNGLLHLIYPGTKHSRFDHSLGVAHLAGKWFDALMFNTDTERSQKFFSVRRDHDVEDGIKLKVRDTVDLFTYMSNSNNRYRNLLSIAGLVHDLGHGPLSHTLESLKLLELTDVQIHVKDSYLLEYFKQKKTKVEHEDFTLIYLNQIFIENRQIDFFSDQENFLIIAALVHKEFKEFILNKIRIPLSTAELNAIRTLSLCISSLFDVDRFDYLKRDSMMAGVVYGAVDADRLIRSLIPILYEQNSEMQSGFLVKSRLVHALDHLLVSLYTTYTLVYLHPTNKLFEKQLTEIVDLLKSHKMIEPLNFQKHSQASDYSLLNELDKNSNKLVSKILNRDFEQTEKTVRQIYNPQGASNDLLSTGWQLIEDHGRKMFKDSAKVWLFDSSQSIYNWKDISLVAQKLGDEKYLPKVYWKHNAFKQELQKLANDFSGLNIGKATKKKF